MIEPTGMGHGTPQLAVLSRGGRCMLGFSRIFLLKPVALMVLALGTASLLLLYFMPTPPSTVLTATSQAGGGYEYLANATGTESRGWASALNCTTPEARSKTSNCWKTES